MENCANCGGIITRSYEYYYCSSKCYEIVKSRKQHESNISESLEDLKYLQKEIAEAERLKKELAKKEAYEHQWLKLGLKIQESPETKVLREAALLIVLNQSSKASFLQRKLKLGYNRAGRILDQLEAFGIVGPFQGSKQREILCHDKDEAIELINKGLMLYHKGSNHLDYIHPSPLQINNVKKLNEYAIDPDFDYDPQLDLISFKNLSIFGSINDSQNFNFKENKISSILIVKDSTNSVSQLINSLIVEYLIYKHPAEFKLFWMSTDHLYQGLNHLFNIDISSKFKTQNINKDIQLRCFALYEEMINRYQLLNNSCSDNIDLYNEKFKYRLLDPSLGYYYFDELVIVVNNSNDFFNSSVIVKQDWISKILDYGSKVGMKLIFGITENTENHMVPLINKFERTILGKNCPNYSKLILGTYSELNNDIIFTNDNTNIKELIYYNIKDEELKVINNFFEGQRGYMKECNALNLTVEVEFYEEFNKVIKDEPKNSTNVESIIQLKIMLDKGLITTEEFIKLKSEILN